MQTVFMLLSIYNRPRLALDQVCEAIGIAKQTSNMLVDIGCVDGAASSSPDAKHGCISNASAVLFPLAEWLSAQAALLQVADHATAMLLQPSVYRKDQP